MGIINQLHCHTTTSLTFACLSPTLSIFLTVFIPPWSLRVSTHLYDALLAQTLMQGIRCPRLDPSPVSASRAVRPARPALF